MHRYSNHRFFGPMAAAGVLAFLQTGDISSAGRGDKSFCSAAAHIEGDLRSPIKTRGLRMSSQCPAEGRSPWRRRSLKECSHRGPSWPSMKRCGGAARHGRGPDEAGRAKAMSRELPRSGRRPWLPHLILDPEQLEAQAACLGSSQDQRPMDDARRGDDRQRRGRSRVVNGETRWVTSQEMSRTPRAKSEQTSAAAAWSGTSASGGKRLDSNCAEFAAATARKSLEDIHDPDAIGPLGERLNAQRMTISRASCDDARHDLRRSAGAASPLPRARGRSPR